MEGPPQGPPHGNVTAVLDPLATTQSPNEELRQFFLNTSINTGVDGAFGGIVDAHNGLVQRMGRAQEALGALQEQQVQASKNLETLRSEHEQGQLQSQQRLEEVKRQSSESYAALQKLVDERDTVLEEKSQKAVQGLDCVLSPKVQSVERAIEDLVTSHSEVRSKILPRWRQDVGTEVQKLAIDLASLRDSMEQQGRKVEARAAQQDARLDEVRIMIEQRITDEVQALRNSLASMEEGSQSLAKAARLDEVHIMIEQRITDEVQALRDRLASMEEGSQSLAKALEKSKSNAESGHDRLERLIEDQARAGAGQGQRLDALEARAPRELLDAQNKDLRIAKLEEAFKEAEYERLSFCERVARDLAGVRDDSRALSDRLDKDLAGVRNDSQALSDHLAKERTSQAAGLDRLRSQLSAELAAEAEALGRRLQGAESAGQSISTKLQGTEQRLESNVLEMQAKLEEESKSLMKRVKEEADGVLAKVKGGEGARLAKLEESVEQLDRVHQQGAKRFDEEIHSLRAELEATSKSAESKIEASGSEAKARITPVQEAVDNLTRELQNFISLKADRDNDTSKLEESVKALEARVRPWKVSYRSISPPATARTVVEDTADNSGGSASGLRGLAATGPAATQPSWSYWPRAPSQRPASAGTRRPGTQTREQPQPCQCGQSSQCGVRGLQIAGPGLAAARAKINLHR